MDIKLSRKRALTGQQRKKQVQRGSSVETNGFNEWPMKTRNLIFLPYFKWNGSLKLEQSTVIGRGKFSKVVKCIVKNIRVIEEEENPNRYKSRGISNEFLSDNVAVKVLEKSTIIAQDMAIQICQERRIQNACSYHCNVLPLLTAWQDDKRLYMGLPLCDRGQLFELWAHRKISGKPFSNVSICVAALQLSSALDFIQTLGVIYRDLKLDNVLISSRGNLQISDFGLSKWLGRHERTRTICGTLAYMAPEVLKGSSYGFEADWWSLGVLLHCLALLRFPFYKGKDHLEMLNNIFEHEDLPNDNNLEESIQNLITCLLVIDDSNRLNSFRQAEELCSKTITLKDMILNHVDFMDTVNINCSQMEMEDPLKGLT